MFQEEPRISSWLSRAQNEHRQNIFEICKKQQSAKVSLNALDSSGYVSNNCSERYSGLIHVSSVLQLSLASILTRSHMGQICKLFQRSRSEDKFDSFWQVFQIAEENSCEFISRTRLNFIKCISKNHATLFRRRTLHCSEWFFDKNRNTCDIQIQSIKFLSNIGCQWQKKTMQLHFEPFNSVTQMACD